MPTSPRIIELVADGAPDPTAVRLAVEALTAGEIVALPTETVYGLAARADEPGAVARLAALKGGGGDQPFTVHVAGDAASHAALAEGVELPGLVARLVERYWPGPMSLVVRGQGGRPVAARGGRAPVASLVQGGWTGVRAPSHPTTAAVLDAAPFPVVLTGSDRGDGPPAVDAEGILRAAGDGDIALVLDGGPAAIGEASTVLRVGRGHFEVVREGIVTLDELRATAGLSILFVCTGNTCRSPMAEGLARAALADALDHADPGVFGYELGSRGVYAGPGAAPSENAVLALRDRGLDISQHASAPAVDREIARTDRVYCLTASHREALLGALPPRAGDHVELLDPAGRDVPDPFGGPPDVYRATAEAIAEMIAARVGEWV